MTDFNGLTTYLSIDLDDLIEDCQVDETKPVRDRSKEAGSLAERFKPGGLLSLKLNNREYEKKISLQIAEKEGAVAVKL